MAATTELPPGYLQEYTGDQLLVIAIVFIPLNVMFVAMRFLARSLQKAPLGLDDILVIPSLILCLSLSAIGISMINYGGVGYHIAAVAATNPEKIIIWGKLLFSSPIVYLWSVTFPKLAILAMFLRIFTHGFYRNTAMIIAAILVASLVANTLVSLSSCKPMAYFWDKSTPNGYCPVDLGKFYIWATFPNIVTDVMMLILPQPMVWKLHTSRSVKLGLSVTFFTGSVGLVASILRFLQFALTNPFADGTWASVPLMRYTIMEPSMYLMASCLPSSRPIFTHVQTFLTTEKLSFGTAWSTMRSWKGRSPGTRDSLHSNPADNTSRTELRRLDSSTANDNQFNGAKSYTRIFSITSESNPELPHTGADNNVINHSSKQKIRVTRDFEVSSDLP